MIFNEPAPVHEDGYAYEVFISYRRSGNVAGWVENHFGPVLDRCLADELPGEPRTFLFVTQDPGTHWPQNLERALRHSRLMVAVLSPPYFGSRWCLAEWHTMRRREAIVGLGGPQDPRGLIYPIRYSDGASFPAEAQDIQQENSFTDWRFPYPQFGQSPDYLPFHNAVVAVAERLAERIAAVPDWRDDWPVERPCPAERPPASFLPRLSRSR